MADDEPVTSPDQHRPMVSRRLARFGAIMTIAILLAMTFTGTHEGNTSKVFLIGIAALIALILILDVILRRSGLRPD